MECFETIALDAKGSSLESDKHKNLHSAKNFMAQCLHKNKVRWVQIWRHDNCGNAALYGVFTMYMHKPVQLKKVE